MLPRGSRARRAHFDSRGRNPSSECRTTRRHHMRECSSSSAPSPAVGSWNTSQRAGRPPSERSGRSRRGPDDGVASHQRTRRRRVDRASRRRVPTRPGRADADRGRPRTARHRRPGRRTRGVPPLAARRRRRARLPRSEGRRGKYSTPAAPYAPARTQTRVPYTADRLRVLLSAIELESTEALVEQVTDRGLAVESVVSPGVEATMESETSHG